MKLSIAVLGLALAYASTSFAGSTGNGWTQRQAAPPVQEQAAPVADHHDDARDEHDRDHHRAPPGATAECRDHSYSMSHHHHGVCLHHGGVLRWIK